ncbi:MAG: hypothetical protein WA364_05690, partial [Candidatus Nitrosopolaris sp.]
MLLAGHAPSGLLNEASQVIDILINNCSSSNTSHHASTSKWQEWRLPGSNPMPYAVYVDRHDIVWL